MRTRQNLIIGLLMLFLACNFPTRTTTPAPVCTPPACKDNEVYYCPDDCPGGCGTGCATPTGQPAKKDPTPEQNPTSTPYIMCTAPACKPDEVYSCKGECLGGCDTICVTLTPTQTPETEETKEQPLPTSTKKPEVVTPPIIESFTAEHNSITQGESLNVTWTASGGTAAGIQWLGSAGTMEGVTNLPPDGSTISISPSNSPVVLNVSNSAGTTTKNLELTIKCAHAWMPELTTANAGLCPMTAEVGWAAQQPFEHGFMIWLEPSQTIYVFFTNFGGQSYRRYEDTFKEGDPESDPNLIPPAGLLQPLRGFGVIWRENAEVRDGLGWAKTGETGFETWRQSYQGIGMHNIRTWLKDINQNIIELDPNASVWRIIEP